MEFGLFEEFVDSVGVVLGTFRPNTFPEQKEVIGLKSIILEEIWV